MADLENLLKVVAESQSAINSLELSSRLNLDHQKVIGAINSIQSHGNVLKLSSVSTKSWELTEEGRKILLNGSYEAVVFNSVPSEGVSQEIIMKNVPGAKIGISRALKNEWIRLVKTENGPVLEKKVESIVDSTRNFLQCISEKEFSKVPDQEKIELRKRKLLNEITIKSLSIEKGAEFTLKLRKPETELTADLLIGDAWKSKEFKAYNFNALGVHPRGGCLHPLMKVRAEYRQIFLEMGFVEMPTNRYVESSFWNFDALFVPQKHPARDALDTFFISEPASCINLPDDLVKKVEKVHSIGDYGSKGYEYDWTLKEAQKNLLRTHTTAISARMLYTLAQQPVFKPVKYFSIDRVFRNENLDATHLAEFHQIEGVVADRHLSLANMIGIIGEFFRKLGIKKLRFKPAYNPYTEPSMEVFSYHDGLRKWVEVGNSGIFRPEMLLPMGLPPDVVVLAWGLSLERPTMIKYGIENIRDLIGPRVNLRMVQTNPLCRVDKA